MTQAFNLSQLANGVDSSGKLDLSTNSKNPSWTTDISANSVTVGKGGASVTTNTAVGVSALASVPSSSYIYNTAIGYQALTALNGGSQNTAVGYTAMAATTSGGANASFGDLSLKSNTTGNYNSALGSEALTANTTGSNNVAVGQKALQANTTASYGTAIGYQAGYSAVTADYNTFVGYYAGRSTTGDQNTFLGKFAGNAITTGSQHTIIGAYNGNQGGLDIRTTSNYVVLSDGGGTPRGVFDGSGNFFVNQTSQTGAEKVGISFNRAGGWGLAIKNTSATSPSNATYVSFYYTSTNTGSINSTGTTTTYDSASDYRLKENIAPMTGALAKVTQLKPCTYTWKINGSAGQGFLAHELQEIVSDCVRGNKDDVNEDGSIKPQMIDTSLLVATLTAAIQELKTIVDAQAAEITALKTKVGI